MLELDTFMLFILAAVLLLITPGPAVIYIVARSVSQGTLADWWPRSGCTSAPSFTSPPPRTACPVFS